jgi:predicted transcriptional regulator
MARRGGGEPDPEPGARRASGALEAAVLSVLWDAGTPLSAADVRERVSRGDGDGELAYTTVVTILSRLHEKGVLSRRRDGRAFRYAPVADQAGLAARRLSALLDAVPDREAVLSRFVEDLSDRDEALLRSLLGDQHGAADDPRPWR